MVISERAAAGLLFVVAGLDRTSARQVLRTGLAGPSERGPDGRVLYDLAAVETLAQRPDLSPQELERVAPLGAGVARFSGQRPWQHRAADDVRAAALAGPWELGASARIALHAYVGAEGRYPLFATVCGYVVAGADIVGPPGWDEGPVRLALAPPGDWYDAVRERRWRPGRGGAALQMWHPRIRAS